MTLAAKCLDTFTLNPKPFKLPSPKQFQALSPLKPPDPTVQTQAGPPPHALAPERPPRSVAVGGVSHPIQGSLRGGTGVGRGAEAIPREPKRHAVNPMGILALISVISFPYFLGSLGSSSVRLAGLV